MKCVVDGCEFVSDGRISRFGYCRVHQRRHSLSGDPLEITNCIIDGCEKEAIMISTKLCNVHNYNKRHTGDPHGVVICIVDGCDKAVTGGAKQWCPTHMTRYARYGQLHLPERKEQWKPTKKPDSKLANEVVRLLRNEVRTLFGEKPEEVLWREVTVKAAEDYLLTKDRDMNLTRFFSDPHMIVKDLINLDVLKDRLCTIDQMPEFSEARGWSR